MWHHASPLTHAANGVYAVLAALRCDLVIGSNTSHIRWHAVVLLVTFVLIFIVVHILMFVDITKIVIFEVVILIWNLSILLR